MGKNQELKKGCRIQGRKEKKTKKERKLVVAVITRIKRHVWFIMEKGRPE
jgi:phage gp16-like protein